MERKIILFCCLLAGTDSAVFLALQNEIPGHPNQCYDRDLTAFYDKGDKMINEYSDKTCGQKVCLGKYEHGEGKVATEFTTCGVMDGPKTQLKTCNITAALGAYPECCVPYENNPPPELCGSPVPKKPDGRFDSNKIRR